MSFEMRMRQPGASQLTGTIRAKGLFSSPAPPLSRSLWLTAVLPQLSAASVCGFGGTSRQWRALACSQPVWRLLRARDLLPFRLSPEHIAALHEHVVQGHPAGPLVGRNARGEPLPSARAHAAL
jgi:hypothetical protein